MTHILIVSAMAVGCIALLISIAKDIRNILNQLKNGNLR